MIKTVWQIRYLRESPYRSESETILVQGTNESDVRKQWIEQGYQKANEGVEEIYQSRRKAPAFRHGESVKNTTNRRRHDRYRAYRAMPN